MKITGLTSVYEVYRASGVTSRQNSPQVESKKDVVAISGEGKSYQVAIKALSDTPDIRQERVEDIKNRIDGGTYNVSDETLADNMLKGFFM